MANLIEPPSPADQPNPVAKNSITIIKANTKHEGPCLLAAQRKKHRAAATVDHASTLASETKWHLS
jgi:hypothetical protein